jgi:hypothetical protein
MHPNITIGCPIFKRDWILPHYFKFLAEQNYPKNRMKFIFNIEDRTTDLLIDILMEKHGFPNYRKIYGDHDLSTQRRTWGEPKYRMMANLRNELLEKVETIYYFSLDSDILLIDPETINKLLKNLENPEIDACSIRIYNSENNRITNTMSWINGSDRAQRIGYSNYDLFPVDITGAAIMMTRKVLDMTLENGFPEYKCHPQGEDLGWSLNCRDAHYKLWQDTRIYASHMMSEGQLRYFLDFGDPRN